MAILLEVVTSHTIFCASSEFIVFAHLVQSTPRATQINQHEYAKRLCGYIILYPKKTFENLLGFVKFQAVFWV